MARCTMQRLCAVACGVNPAACKGNRAAQCASASWLPRTKRSVHRLVAICRCRLCEFDFSCIVGCRPKDAPRICVEIPRPDAAEKDVPEVSDDPAVERVIPRVVSSFDLLVRRLVRADQIGVVHAETHSEPHQSGAVDREGRCHRRLGYRLDKSIASAQDMLLLDLKAQQEQLHQRGCEHDRIEQASGGYEREKEPIIALADAIPDPRAVVVEALDAVLANRAVRTPRRPIYVARDAILQLEGVPT
mmetsp:Transcript_89408/g.251790  ORF Transcript_89408/g.251790 Transcript_89408/m.251790 type:complete len:246 (+) Transcript_89408:135-872(+)